MAFIRITDETLVDASTRSSTTNAYSPPKPGSTGRIPGAEGSTAPSCWWWRCATAEGPHLRSAHPAPDGSGVGVVHHPKPVATARSEGSRALDGWSLFDPTTFKRLLLAMPADAGPVQVICAWGRCPSFDRPALELDGWAMRGHCGIARKPMELSVGAHRSPSRRIGHADREVDVFGRHVSASDRGKRLNIIFTDSGLEAQRWLR